MPVTMREVARKAGVSLKTVSRVINNEDNVAPKTREKVLEVAEKLGYVPNLAARNLSRGRTMTIGLVLGWELSSTYSSTLAQHIQTECSAREYNLLLFSTSSNLADKLVTAYLGKQIDGLILETIPGMDTSLRARLEDMNIPFLVIHPGSQKGMETVSWVSIDDRGSARAAVQYLVGLGHSCVGAILDSGDTNQSKGRLRGYRDALDHAGIPFQESLIYNIGTADFSSGYDGTLTLLSRHPDMTAVFCHTDEAAMGAMSAVWQSGMRVPDDISLVGFDDIRYAAMMIPPLTTIHQPIERIAGVAVEYIIRLIDDPEIGRLTETLPTKLVIRDTCTSPRT